MKRYPTRSWFVPFDYAQGKQAGMTLLEAVVYVGLFTVVIVAVTTSVQFFYRSNAYTVAQAAAVTSAERGIDKMTRILREVAYASDGAYPIVSFGPNDLTFYADVDEDPFAEKVHYYIAGDLLSQGVIDASGDPPVYTGAEVVSIVSDHVLNTVQGVSVFTYYDKNGAQITDYTRIAEVRFVTVSVVVDIDQTRTPPAVTLRSAAALRNLVGH